jgi:hypothetical protein
MNGCVRRALSSLAELADNRTAAVGERHRSASLDNGWRLRAHDIRAEIEFARRDADHRDHERPSKTDHHNFEVGGPVCGVQRRIHASTRTPPTPEEYCILGHCAYTNVQDAARARCANRYPLFPKDVRFTPIADNSLQLPIWFLECDRLSLHCGSARGEAISVGGYLRT